MSKAHKSGRIEDVTPSRRTFLKGATIGTVGVLGIQSPIAVQNAQAIDWETALDGWKEKTGTLLLGGPVALGWAFRDEIIDLTQSNPSSNISKEYFVQDAYEIMRTRKSVNDSTFIDNENILSGIDDTAYSEGKIVAIELLNQEETQQTIEDEAIKTVEDYFASVEKNLLKSWNEAVNELVSLVGKINENGNVVYNDIFNQDAETFNKVGYTNTYDFGEADSKGETTTLVNGSDFTVDAIDANYGGYYPGNKYAVSDSDDDYAWDIDDSQINIRIDTPEGVFEYLDYTTWTNLRNEFQSRFDSIKNGLVLWIDNVYNDVQSGDIDTSELLTTRELANLQSENEDTPEAYADLMALNIATDLEREAEIYLPNLDATLYGSIGSTESRTLQVGEINPANESGDFYLTHDLAKANGNWNGYDNSKGVDGGEIAFTQEPWENTNYTIETGGDETANVTYSDFTQDSDSGNWIADISGQLENSISTIEKVSFTTTVEETTYQTIQLSDTFEIVSFTDSDGNNYDSAEYTNSVSQDDTNYITQEEWEQRQKRYEETIEKYEQEEESSGGGGVSTNGLTDNFLFERFYGIPVWGYLTAGTLSAYVFGDGDE